MSKKKKDRFKKIIKAQIAQQIAQNPASAVIKKTPIPAQTKSSGESTPSIQAPVSIPTAEDEKIKLIKHDLKKSAVIIGSIVVIIVATYFLDNRFGILAKSGTEVFRLLHLNI